jgi:hypothetical protein
MPLIKNLINDIIENKVSFNNLNYDKIYFNSNIKSKISCLDYPEFNANVRFELWNDIDNKEIIRIYYNSLLLFELT